ncbi:hypothetical protein B0H13DRAFT_1974432 [Mycena leptocephala]|nr:hypothetical protein B0H13DRAFT_1974432 [Mycena leptocephala]
MRSQGLLALCPLLAFPYSIAHAGYLSLCIDFALPTSLPPQFDLFLLVHFLYSCFCTPVGLIAVPPLPPRLSRLQS